MGAQARIHGSGMRARPFENRALVARRVEHEVLPLFQASAVKVLIAETFPLDEAATAYDRFEVASKLGKVVITL
jgi:NADPH:quinone reductase